MKQRLELIMSVVILICACILAKTSAVYVTGHQVKEPSDCIMIDVGHGGFDSGKVGVNGELEKDINLQIALKLKKTLEDQGMSVIMTREEDKGLYDEGASNKKAQDLQRRCDQHIIIQYFNMFFMTITKSYLQYRIIFKIYINPCTATSLPSIYKPAHYILIRTKYPPEVCSLTYFQSYLLNNRLLKY